MNILILTLVVCTSLMSSMLYSVKEYPKYRSVCGIVQRDLIYYLKKNYPDTLQGGSKRFFYHSLESLFKSGSYLYGHPGAVLARLNSCAVAFGHSDDLFEMFMDHCLKPVSYDIQGVYFVIEQAFPQYALPNEELLLEFLHDAANIFDDYGNPVAIKGSLSSVRYIIRQSLKKLGIEPPCGFSYLIERLEALYSFEAVADIVLGDNDKESCCSEDLYQPVGLVTTAVNIINGYTC